MNTSALKLTFMTFLACSIILSCQKEKDNTEEQCKITMSNLSGTYKLTALKYKATSNATEQDFLILLGDCMRDDLMTMKANGDYDYADAGTACSPDNSASGEWALQGNRLVSDDMLNGTISGFDCKTLVYYLDDVYTDGDKMTFTMTRQ